MSRLPFLATVVAVAIVSFVWLAARTRPSGGGPGIEPVLYVSGLHQPRALTVGGDGSLYLAEAGWSAGSTASAGSAGSTTGQEGVPGRVSRVDGREQAVLVAPDLPPAGAEAPFFAPVGLSSLAPTGDADLALLFGPTAGRPVGSVARLTPPSRDDPRGGDSPAIDPVPLVVEGQATDPPAPPAAVWSTTRGNGGAVFATLPLANLLVRLDPATGRSVPVTGFIGAGGSNPLPTGLAPAAGGSLFVAHFGPQPFRRGSGRVVQVGADGLWQPRFESLTFPVALAVSPGGQLYVLEFAAGYDAGTGQFTPRSGRVLALGPEPGRRRTVMAAVDYPTAMAIAPNGDLFVAESGVFRRPGEGRVLFIPGQTLRAADAMAATGNQ